MRMFEQKPVFLSSLVDKLLPPCFPVALHNQAESNKTMPVVWRHSGIQGKPQTDERHGDSSGYGNSATFARTSRRSERVNDPKPEFIWGRNFPVTFKVVYFFLHHSLIKCGATSFVHELWVCNKPWDHKASIYSLSGVSRQHIPSFGRSLKPNLRYHHVSPSTAPPGSDFKKPAVCWRQRDSSRPPSSETRQPEPLQRCPVITHRVFPNKLNRCA